MRFIFFLLWCAIINFPAALCSAAQNSCITAECHIDIGKAKYLHGPLAADICIVCHIPGEGDQPPENHKLSYYKEGTELCLDCHDKLEKFLKGKTNHGPLEDGECIICHDPHQADNRFLLVETKMQDLCFTCHEDTMTNQNFVHGPVAGGDCVVCHDPHASKNDFLLTSTRLELCQSCHEETKIYFKRKYVHKPVKESCENCHTPHGSKFAFHLKHDTTDLCWECHREFVQQLNSSDSKHTAITKNGCLGCHQPHSSDNDKGLRENKKEICLSCHEIMKRKIRESQYLHGPVKEGDCVACHDAHATNYAKHLVKFFPDDFYFPYKIENYAMCFGCHNKEVATEESTETLTNFRNGKKNLHFLHVNREKGRSCKACHEVHAGNQEKHVRQEVPFGSSNWLLPINYTKTETGGGCVVGCHKEKKYDRKNPVLYVEQTQTQTKE